MHRYLKRFFPLILLPALLLLALTACDSGSDTAKKNPAAAIPEKVVLAEIDGQAVTGADLRSYLGLFKGPEARLPEGPEARTRLLEHLLDRKLLLIAAAKEGYDKLDELRKHGSLEGVEKETIILRAYLTDKVSRPATPDEAAVSAWREKHPGLTVKKAREELATTNQKKLFRQLMTRLRKEHKVVIRQQNLAALPAG